MFKGLTLFENIHTGWRISAGKLGISYVIKVIKKKY